MIAPLEMVKFVDDLETRLGAEIVYAADVQEIGETELLFAKDRDFLDLIRMSNRAAKRSRPSAPFFQVNMDLPLESTHDKSRRCEPYQ